MELKVSAMCRTWISRRFSIQQCWGFLHAIDKSGDQSGPLRAEKKHNSQPKAGAMRVMSGLAAKRLNLTPVWKGISGRASNHPTPRAQHHTNPKAIPPG